MSFPKRYPLGLKELLNNIRITLQKSLLPSGAIVWFNLSNPPSGWVVCDGTNGTPNLIGRYPLGATSGIGGTVAAGLPAHTHNYVRRYTTSSNGTYGTLFVGQPGRTSVLVNSVTTNEYESTTSAASNSVYGNSTTVTPPSVKLLPCMKL